LSKDFFAGVPAEEIPCTIGTLLRAVAGRRLIFPRKFPLDGGQPNEADRTSYFQYEESEGWGYLGVLRSFIEVLAFMYRSKDYQNVRKLEDELELYAAHLTARLPVLTVMAADGQLPRMRPDGEGSDDNSRITITLSVEWSRVITVLVAIHVGQLIAVRLAYFYCRNVFMRDSDSYLSVARLLREAMNKVEGGTGLTGQELGKIMGKQGVRMRYGTRRLDFEESLYELDMLDTDEHPVRDHFPRDAKYV